MDDLDLLNVKIKNQATLKEQEIFIVLNSLLKSLDRKYQVYPTIQLLDEDEENKKIMGSFHDQNNSCSINLYLDYYYQKIKEGKQDANLLLLYTFVHEFWHAAQNKQINNTIKKGIFNEQAYQNLNCLITTNLNYDFYREYHGFFESEIDAYLKANQTFIEHQHLFLTNYHEQKENFRKASFHEIKKRKTPAYQKANNFLHYVNFNDIPIDCLNTFTLLEYDELKYFSISQLVDYREDICILISEQMLKTNDYNNGLKQLKSTFDFFDYLIVKKINTFNDQEINCLKNNLNYDIADKLSFVGERKNCKVLQLKR